MKTTALNTSPLNDKLFQRGCDCVGFTPGLTYAYDSSAKTVTVTEATVYSSADFLKRINVLVHDAAGGTKAGTITLSKGGGGYTSAPTVVITGGGGSGATATATIANGIITGITVTAAGTGYTTVPTISFTGGGGTGALATATIGSGGVTAIALTAGTTGAIDVATLDPLKGLAITAMVISNGGCKSDGSVQNIAASGSIGNWSENWKAELAG